MSRIVKLEAILEDDGRLDLIKIYSESRLTPEEWLSVSEQLNQRLPGQFEYTAKFEELFG